MFTLGRTNLDCVDVDRSALAATKVYGIMEDLGMNTTDFATVISILFVGYLPFQIPSNLLITKISRPGLCKPIQIRNFSNASFR